MAIHIECHRCRKKYKAPSKLEGRQFRCQKCGEMLDVVELLPIVEPEKLAAQAPPPQPPAAWPPQAPPVPTPPQAPPSAAFPQAPVVPPQTAYPQAPVAYPQPSAMGYPQAPPVAYPQAPGVGYPQAASAGPYPQAVPLAGYPPMAVPTAFPQQAAPPGSNSILDIMNEDFASQAAAAPSAMASPSPFSPAGSAFASGFESEYERPKKKKKKRCRSSDGDGVQVQWAALWLFFLLLEGVVFGLLLIAPPFGLLIVVAISRICPFVIVGCVIWVVVAAFQESVLCGFLVLFLPFYWLVYVITRWQRCKGAFLLILFLILMVFVTGLVTGIALVMKGDPERLHDLRVPTDEPGPFTQTEPRSWAGDPVAFGLSLLVESSSSIS